MSNDSGNDGKTTTRATTKNIEKLNKQNIKKMNKRLLFVENRDTFG